MGDIQTLDISTIMIRLLLSVILGGIIGFERGAKNHSAGIRTHILVCLASALVMMTNEFIILKYGVGDPTRMGAQVISGIGFLGAGTILITSNQKIRGLTTAAGLWASAVVGLAIGIGFYLGALISILILIIIITLFTPLKNYLNRRSKIVDFHIILESLEAYNRMLIYLNTSSIKIIEIQDAVGYKGKGISGDNQLSCNLSLKLNENFEHLKIKEELLNLAGVIYLEEIR